MSVHVVLVNRDQTVLLPEGASFETDEGEILITDVSEREVAIFAAGEWVYARITQEPSQTIGDDDGEGDDE